MATNIKKAQPFIKWLGGKRQIVEQLRGMMPMEYNRYYEPFVGGGALLFDVQPPSATINDINPQLINVYNQLKENTKVLLQYVRLLNDTPSTKDYYITVRERYNEKIKREELDAECAAIMLWLNKHCFNGVYRVNSKGLFNVPYNNKDGYAPIDIDNLRRVGEYLQVYNIEIKSKDFEKVCADMEPNDFVYFDPPYIPLTETSNFTSYTKGGFSYNDQVRLASLCKKLNRNEIKFMLSNHNAPIIPELYEGFNIRTLSVKRSVNRDGSKRTGEEIVITNY